MIAAQTRLALDAKLPLRTRTAEHLRRLSESREYLFSRYEPAGWEGSQLNRLGRP